MSDSATFDPALFFSVNKIVIYNFCRAFSLSLSSQIRRLKKGERRWLRKKLALLDLATWS